MYHRGNYLPTSHDSQQSTPLHCNESETTPLALLQSISMTLSDVQMKLSIIQEQNSERDTTLKQLEKDISELRRSVEILMKHQNDQNDFARVLDD